MRRSASAVAIAVGLALLLGWYVYYTQRVVAELRREASRAATLYVTVYGALADSAADHTTTLFNLSRLIPESGVPVVLTDWAGRPSASVNTPYDGRITDPAIRDELRAYIARLDRENPPIVLPGVTTVHIGDTPLVRGLRFIPALQALLLALLLGAAVYILRTRERARREQVWAGMARESAHQLGTPLSSLAGWVELLSEREADDLTATALGHMRGDLERLDRVARRFERIGRDPKREPVDTCALVERVGAYFRARVPTLAHSVVVTTSCAAEPLHVHGDPVLLEWAIEALAKNAVDALAGRGGRIDLSVSAVPGGGARIRVSDDGPGIARDLRLRIFEPGFSTKSQGWGIGLALARRIVEGAHGGKLLLVPTEKGATFDVIIPA